MRTSTFDNLEEWGTVLETLEAFKSKKVMDSHQKELVRLIRYEDNWRLREAAISAACHVKTPASDLIEELLNIIKREDIYLDARILATDALERIFENASRQKKGDRKSLEKMSESAVDCLTKLSLLPQAPIFLKAIVISHERIKRLF